MFKWIARHHKRMEEYEYSARHHYWAAVTLLSMVALCLLFFVVGITYDFLFR